MTRMEELAWFVGSMMAVNSLVFVLCGALELVERYGLFRDAKIHKKVHTVQLALISANGFS